MNDLLQNRRGRIVAGPVVPTCSRCRQTIPPDDINVARDVAYCRACNLTNSLSELTSLSELEQLYAVDTSRPPEGVTYRSTGGETIIRATHRSWGTAIGSLAFGLFWNGIVSIFVLLALSSTLQHVGVSIPNWFPAPKMKGGPMTVGMTIFMWLFLTPFIAIGLGMVYAFLSSLFGHTEFRFRSNQATVFSGIGPIGFPKRFDPRTVESVGLVEREWRSRNGNQHSVDIVIQFKDARSHKFGSSLREDRRQFVAAAMRKLLIPPSK